MSKKILFLAMWFLPRVGGMEMSSYEIVNILRDNGNDVVVITADHENALEFDSKQSFVIERAKGVFLQNLAFSNNLRRIYNYFSYYRKFYKKVSSVLKSYKPDEVIIVDAQTRNWFGFYSNKLKINPIVIVSMPEKKKNKIKRLVVSRTLKKASAIYCVSNSTKEKMCDTFGEKFRNKMSVVYRNIGTSFLEKPIDTERVNSIKQRYKLEGKFVILSVCRLSRKKGVGELITALHNLGEKALDIALLICAEGPDRERLEHLVEEYNLKERVIFCGKVEKEYIIDYYDTCDLFVLPSIEESFGRVYAEAGARHKASIGCFTGGVVEVIDHQNTGLLIEPGDVDALAEAIVKFKDNTDFKTMCENNMYSKVKKSFSYQVLKKEWKEIIKR